jgi:opacity protein-like surface antigen
MRFYKGKCVIAIFFLANLYSSMAFSAQAYNPFSQLDFSYLMKARGVVSLLGGYANQDVGNSQHSYAGTDDDIFIYQNSNDSKNSGFVGAFIGFELPLSCTNLATQAGVEYDYFGPVNINGAHSVGIEAATATPYNYHYHLQSQQVLAVAKLLYMNNRIYHPYLSIGLGAAFNRAYGFSATTSQTGSINIAPTFTANVQSAFSYNLSLGVDVDVVSNVRLGLAYRFSDFGRSSLGKGQVAYNDYQSAVPFSLSNAHTYVNQLLLEVTYLI